MVYIAAGPRHMYALKAATGARLWTYTTGCGFSGSPAVANGVVYMG